MHISVEIVNALLRVQDLWSVLGSQIFAEDDPYVTGGSAHNSHSFLCSVSVKFDSWQCNLDLEDAENSATLSLTSRDVDFRYSLQEALSLSVLANMLKMDYLHLHNGSNCNLLCSKTNEICGTINASTQHASLSIQELPSSGSSGTCCLELQYQAQAGGFARQQECSLFLCDIDLHIYPKLSGLLQKFIHKVQSSIARTSVKSSRLSENKIDLELADNEWCDSGFSNFYNFEQTACPKFSSHHFPFVSIVNSGFLNSLKSSTILSLSELKELCIKNEEFSEKMPCITKSSNMRLPSTGIKEVSRSANNNCFSMKLALNRINAYFHDSSCILGILTVPTSISCLRFCETDYWDLQSSIQGVTLSSSWSFPNIHEALLGPSSASNFPILNIRVRKGKMNTMLPATEISIGIQHVCCILSSDFLSLLIGYFSLPDWTFDYEDSEIVMNDLLFKFEVLNSTLLLPLENHEYCVHLELPQLVGSFIPVSNSSGAFGEIPSNCMFPESTCSEAVKIVNVFGRSTSLSLLLLGNDKKFLLRPAKCMSNANMPLITQLDADLWIQIPLDTKDDSQNSTTPFLVMMSLSICNLIARGTAELLLFLSY